MGRRASDLSANSASRHQPRSSTDVEFVWDAGLNRVHHTKNLPYRFFERTRFGQLVFLPFEKLLEDRFFLRKPDNVNGLIGGNVREFLGDFNGAIKVSNLVNQPQSFRLRPGPFAALGNLID